MCIIQLYEIIETDNSYYLVTEGCMGGDMMQHIYKHQFLEEKEVRKYMRQIVSAATTFTRETSFTGSYIDGKPTFLAFSVLQLFVLFHYVHVCNMSVCT